MKIYLDDIRPHPDGWVRTYTASETIELLANNIVSDISLDHDLGDENVINCGNGYDVLLYIEEKVANGIITNIPNMQVHSANPPARLRMEMAIKSINKFKII